MTGREALLAEVRRYIGKRELLEGGKPTNRSPYIDYWNLEAGVALGSPYCCSGVTQCGIQAVGRSSWPFKDTALVSALVADATRLGRFTRDWQQAQPGDLVVFYFDTLGRWAHVGVIGAIDAAHVTSYDMNTTPTVPTGSPADRDGAGNFQKTRPHGPHVAYLLWP